MILTGKSDFFFLHRFCIKSTATIDCEWNLSKVFLYKTVWFLQLCMFCIISTFKFMSSVNDDDCSWQYKTIDGDWWCWSESLHQIFIIFVASEVSQFTGEIWCSRSSLLLNDVANDSENLSPKTMSTQCLKLSFINETTYLPLFSAFDCKKCGEGVATRGCCRWYFILLH